MIQSDRRLFKEIVRLYEEKTHLSLSPQKVLMAIGRFFIGFPYRRDVLRKGGREHLVVNLREQDCVTFVENSLALLYVLFSEHRSFEKFKNILRRIRYRGGRIQGYLSRLHYFSEWMKDNERKGVLKEVSKELGGRPLRKSIHFMTDHLTLYPSLRHRENFYRMKAIEKKISAKPFFLIPKENLPRIESRIQEGDIIAIVTQKEGLDIQHVGFAAKIRNRIHLLHASEKDGKVTLSKETLYRYLMKSRDSLGIRVARVKMNKL